MFMVIISNLFIFNFGMNNSYKITIISKSVILNEWV